MSSSESQTPVIRIAVQVLQYKKLRDAEYNWLELFVLCNLLSNESMIFCRYYQEFAPLGTAGGIYHFRDQIQSGNPEAFFVLNSDVCGDFPLTEMLRYHRSNRHGDHHSHRELYTMLGTEVGSLLSINHVSSVSQCYNIASRPIA